MNMRYKLISCEDDSQRSVSIPDELVVKSSVIEYRKKRKVKQHQSKKNSPNTPKAKLSKKGGKKRQKRKNQNPPSATAAVKNQSTSRANKLKMKEGGKVKIKRNQTAKRLVH